MKKKDNNNNNNDYNNNNLYLHNKNAAIKCKNK